MNQFTAALSIEPLLTAALEECREKACSSLSGARPDLALVFASMHHRAGFESLARDVQEATGARVIMGCTGETVIGGAREVEGHPALALWLAHLPGVELTPFHMSFEERDDESWNITGMPDLGTLSSAERASRRQSLLVFGEPFSFPMQQWLASLNEHHPGLLAFGGMASGAMSPGEHRLFLQDRVLERGAAMVLVEGLSVRNVVSQGCRPVGPAMVITKGEDNVIKELAGKPAMDKLREVFSASNARDRILLQRALHVGQVVDEHLSNPGIGDFLIKNVVGADQESGALVIGDFVRRGRTVRFHVRDAESADEDLKQMLRKAGKGRTAALLFSCNGRGTRLFETSDHDARCVRDELGDIPVAGFFAQGEIGPVGSRNFLHGFTASLALFGGD